LILFAKVEDAFSISGLGCVIVFKPLSDVNLRVRDPIQLRTQDGQIKDTYVAGIERVKYNLLASVEDRSKVGISLPLDITKKDTPPGTEIWLLNSPGENS
jgi:hypothetical protein